MRSLNLTCVALGSLGSLVACRSQPQLSEEPLRAEPASAPPQVQLPTELADRAASSWDYLRARYDANGDGRIDLEEYDRGDDPFQRLDLNEDGAVTVADFPELESSSFRGFYRDQRVLRVLGTYFQADDDSSTLHLDELEWMVSTYDTNLDEHVDEDEFRAGALEFEREIEDGDVSGTSRAMMGEYEPWALLVEYLDENSDGKLGSSEFVAFFRARDDGDAILSFREETEPPAAVDASGVAKGEPAPDFRLAPPDGGPRVALSSFRNERPVALIFGSYT